jgi:Protein of unknown function (DUF3826)
MNKGLLDVKKILQKNTPPARAHSFPFYIFNFYALLKILLVTGLMIFGLQVFAQPGSEKQESDYRKVITERSAKIVNVLEITDSGRYYEVLTDIVNQYSQLNTIDEQDKAAITEVKKQSLPKETIDDAVKKQKEEKSFRLKQLHAEFIAHLQENLTNEQIEKVKDGMTYRVFPITYGAYQDMLPTLTKEQKEKIYGWLKEARELAMDEGSSERKHAVFGKYKGRINNYLSAAGYDLKKETEAWQKRIKERGTQKPD